MHAIYLALGAGIPHHQIAPLATTEIAGRVAGWLGIEKPRPAAPAESAPKPAR
jgi:hypothetical protein